jgi:primosomal protein N' (replication factor Y)
LVGVIDADIGLANGDPRASERTFQLLQQVTGRAGRGIGSGRGLLQSWQPKHPVMQALLTGDKEAFYNAEINARLNADLPPYTRLAALIISHKDKSIAEQHARSLARTALGLGPHYPAKPAGGQHNNNDFVVFGPAEAPLSLLRGKFRFRLLIKAPRQLDVQSFIRTILANAPKPASQLRVTIDIDPQSFL